MGGKSLVRASLIVALQRLVLWFTLAQESRSLGGSPESHDSVALESLLGESLQSLVCASLARCCGISLTHHCEGGSGRYFTAEGRAQVFHQHLKGLSLMPLTSFPSPRVMRFEESGVEGRSDEERGMSCGLFLGLEGSVVWAIEVRNDKERRMLCVLFSGFEGSVV